MSRTGGGKEVLTIAAVGVGMAALGLGLAAFPGAATLGVLGGAAFSSSFARRAKPPLRPTDMRRDEQGRVENWPQVLRAVQQGVRCKAALLARSPACCWPSHLPHAACYAAS